MASSRTRNSAKTPPSRPGPSGWLPSSSTVAAAIDRREARSVSFTLVSDHEAKTNSSGDAEKRLTRVYQGASRAEGPAQLSSNGTVSKISTYGSALGAAAYRYLSGSVVPTPRPNQSDPQSTAPQPGLDHCTPMCSNMEATDQPPVTPTRPPPATPDLSCSSPSPSSPFEWSDLHRHPRYSSSSASSRFSRISYASHTSTLSSIPSFGPTTPRTPPTLALPPLRWQPLPDVPAKSSDSPPALSSEDRGVGLGLSFEDTSTREDDDSEEGDSFDADVFARNLDRLDSMLVQIQTMADVAEAALSVTTHVSRPSHPVRSRSPTI